MQPSQPHTNWTPKVAEELLFRSLMQHEEIASLMPPAPRVDRSTVALQYEAASRPLRHFFSLPAPDLSAAAASKNVVPTSATVPSVPKVIIAPTATASTAVAQSTVQKSAVAAALAARTPKNREATPPPPSTAMPAPSTPKALPPAGTPRSQLTTPTAKRGRSEADSPQSRRVKLEWPADVPTNAMLKGKTRAQLMEATAQRIAMQQCFDPDLIFRQDQAEFPLREIFAKFPKAVRLISTMRGASGDWNDDTFSKEEEEMYKEQCGFEYRGPSQHQLPLMAGAVAQLQSARGQQTRSQGPSSTISAAKSSFLGGLDAVYKAIPSFHATATASTISNKPDIMSSGFGGRI